MRFEIDRTSDWKNNKPCEGAFIDSEPPWPNKGMKQWLIELNSLEDLIYLAKSEGNPIILNTWETLPSLEIYDDYRE